MEIKMFHLVHHRYFASPKSRPVTIGWSIFYNNKPIVGRCNKTPLTRAEARKLVKEWNGEN